MSESDVKSGWGAGGEHGADGERGARGLHVRVAPFARCRQGTDNAPPIIDNEPPIIDNAPPIIDNTPPIIDNAPPIVVYGGGVVCMFASPPSLGVGKVRPPLSIPPTSSAGIDHLKPEPRYRSCLKLILATYSQVSRRRVAYPRNPKPETRNPKFETRNPTPDTRNPTPETRNPKRGRCRGWTTVQRSGQSGGRT